MNSSEESTQPPKAHKYKCNACGKEYTRESEKKWMPSYCGTIDCLARLYRSK